MKKLTLALACFSLCAIMLGCYGKKNRKQSSRKKTERSPQLYASDRVADHQIDKLFINRWSPRAMSGEPISQEQLFSLFEAARWAPSSSNSQPWRFIYAQRDTPNWNAFLDLLVPFNKEWAQHAAVLIIIASKKAPHDKFSRTHAFDTGAASQNLALQASIDGLVAHGMGGFDYQKAAEVARLSNDYEVLAMCAIGKPGNKEQLSEALLKREVPSSRDKIETFIFEGQMPELNKPI